MDQRVVAVVAEGDKSAVAQATANGFAAQESIRDLVYAIMDFMPDLSNLPAQYEGTKRRWKEISALSEKTLESQRTCFFWLTDVVGTLAGIQDNLKQQQEQILFIRRISAEQSNVPVSNAVKELNNLCEALDALHTQLHQLLNDERREPNEQLISLLSDTANLTPKELFGPGYEMVNERYSQERDLRIRISERRTYLLKLVSNFHYGPQKELFQKERDLYYKQMEIAQLELQIADLERASQNCKHLSELERESLTGDLNALQAQYSQRNDQVQNVYNDAAAKYQNQKAECDTRFHNLYNKHSAATDVFTEQLKAIQK